MNNFRTKTDIEWARNLVAHYFGIDKTQVHIPDETLLIAARAARLAGDAVDRHSRASGLDCETTISLFVGVSQRNAAAEYVTRPQLPPA